MSTSTPASLWRRLAAILYDGFLIFAIWAFSTILIISLLTEGQALSGPTYQLFLYLETAGFYIYFWTFKGQTLGMQVWKIRTVNDTGEILTPGESIARFFFATFSVIFLGLGFVWILFDKDQLAWHDRASGTRVLYLGKDPYVPAKEESTLE